MMQCDWPIEWRKQKAGCFCRIQLTGYEEIPTWIMQGYMTLAVEAYEQLAETNSPLPTHLILQAGWDRLLAVLWVILLKNAGKYP